MGSFLRERFRPVSGPVEIADRALDYVSGNFGACFLLSVAPSLALADGVFWALVHAHELAADGRLPRVALALGAAFLAKGVFVAAQMEHIDSVVAGHPLSPGRSLARALRHLPRAVAARSAGVLLLAAGLATLLPLTLLPIAVLASRRPAGRPRRLVAASMTARARPFGEGWTKIPCLQLLMAGIALFFFANVLCAEGLAIYLLSGLSGPWQNALAALSPLEPLGLAAAVLAALSLAGPVAAAADRFLEEDLEGRSSGRDLELRLAQARP